MCVCVRTYVHVCVRAYVHVCVCAICVFACNHRMGGLITGKLHRCVYEVTYCCGGGHHIQGFTIQLKKLYSHVCVFGVRMHA